MKPWLLNVLACPIDKHHPLEAYFYKWENSEDELERTQKEAGNPKPEFKDQYKILIKQIVDGTISFSSIQKIKDDTGSSNTYKLLSDSLNFINKLSKLDELDSFALKEYPNEIDLLYRYLNLVEVEEGLIVCPECGRWYPIGSAVETIPELMPDDLREEERDIEWLKKWSEKVPEKVRNEGKPFNLS